MFYLHTEKERITREKTIKVPWEKIKRDESVELRWNSVVTTAKMMVMVKVVGVAVG